VQGLVLPLILVEIREQQLEASELQEQQLQKIVTNKKFDTWSIAKLTENSFRMFTVRMHSLLTNHGISETGDVTIPRPAVFGIDQDTKDKGSG